MPESRVVFHRSSSAPLAVEVRIFPSTGDFDAIPEESFSDMNRSRESLDSLDLLPDIVIPPMLRDPLPLQCLAASALPQELKDEVNNIVEQYSGLECVDGADGLDEEMSSEGGESSSAYPAVVEKVVLKKDILPEWGNDTYSEIGVRITGGVRCNHCNVLHAVITKVSQSVADKGYPDVKEGQCVVQWCGQSLEGASFERVKGIIQTTAEWTEVELAVKDCIGVDLTTQKWYGMSTDLSVLQSSFRRKSRIQVQEDSDLDSPTHLPKLSSRATSSKSRPNSLEPPLTLYNKGRPLSDHSSGSSSPEQRASGHFQSVNLEVPSLEVTYAKDRPQQTKPKSLLIESCTGYLNGMIQLVLEYDQETEYLRIKLYHVKSHASKESLESADVFINTYLIPDTREQGVRSVKLTGPMHTHDVDSTPAYSIIPDELQEVALRVTLWDASKPKHIAFKGEVLLSLSDAETINLAGKPMWFTMCAEDPNLPHLPKPVHYKQKHPFLHRFKNLTHSAAAVSNSLKVQAIKTSNSITSGLSDLNPSHYLNVGTISKRRHKSMPRKVRATQSTDNLTDTSVKNEEKQKKFASIMRVLKASVSTDEELSSNHDRDFTTLDRGTRRKTPAIDIEQQQPERPLSDSFHYIPSLRGSLHAKKGITVYSFLDEMDKAISKSADYLDSIDRDTEAAHYQLVASHSTDELDSPFTSENNSRSMTPASVSEYDSADDHLEPENKAIPKVRLSLCSPAQPFVLPEPESNKDLGVYKLSKHRSKSVGDIEELDSDVDEYEHSLTPELPSPTLISVSDVDQDETPPTKPQRSRSSLERIFCESGGASGTSSGTTQSLDRNEAAATPKSSKKRSLAKWSSLDNILGSRSKSKKAKRSLFTSSEASLRSRTSIHEKGVVNLKLDLLLNDFNPSNPVLVVKVTDIVVAKKDLSSEYTMKCCIVHNSTGVCLIKRKTKVSPKHAEEGTPLGLLQFETDITNLSLWVSLSANRFFSKKHIGEVTIDLSSLNLGHDSPDSRWHQFRKNT